MMAETIQAYEVKVKSYSRPYKSGTGGGIENRPRVKNWRRDQVTVYLCIDQDAFERLQAHLEKLNDDAHRHEVGKPRLRDLTPYEKHRLTSPRWSPDGTFVIG